MAFYHCPRCGGVPGVTACCSEAAKSNPTLAYWESVRRDFERWAVEKHGGFDLKPMGEGGETENGLFPSTYFYRETELAWRAYAHAKSDAAPATSSHPQGR